MPEPLAIVDNDDTRLLLYLVLSTFSTIQKLLEFRKSQRWQKRRKITGNFSLVDWRRLKAVPLARTSTATHRASVQILTIFINPNWNVKSEIFRSSVFAVGFKKFLLHFALNTRMSKWKSNICFDFSVWIDFSFVGVAKFRQSCYIAIANDSVEIAQLPN